MIIIDKGDFKGEYNVKIDPNNMIPYKQFFKKIGGEVWEFYKIGNEEWKSRITPFNQIPYTEL